VVGISHYLQMPARVVDWGRAESSFLRRRAPPIGHSDGWLDAKSAARYLEISENTFDKYRYKTNPRIKGFRLDGKILYKRSDLDAFVKLYELKSVGGT
jgi:hypothetical protein